MSPTAWRLAYSLEQLRTEVNTRWPNRSKASDGTIGDPAHAATASDHNPNPAGIVCALDITHDPQNGPDIETLGRQLAAHPHPNCKYLIFNRKLASRVTMWQTRTYTGDPHTNHLHVSVGVGPDGRSRDPYDDRTPNWLTPEPAPTPTPPLEADDMTPTHCVDRKGRHWFFIVGTDNDVYASTDNSGFFKLAPTATYFTSGLSAITLPDGRITVAGRGGDGRGYQIVFTPDDPRPPTVELIDSHPHQIHA